MFLCKILIWFKLIPVNFNTILNQNYISLQKDQLFYQYLCCYGNQTFTCSVGHLEGPAHQVLSKCIELIAVIVFAAKLIKLEC